MRDAYLLCRIADTIEDAPNLSAGEKAALFDLLAESFEDQAIAGSLADRLTSDGIPGIRRHADGLSGLTQRSRSCISSICRSITSLR